MKILRVADVANHRAGGMARMMHFTADALRADGHQVDFLFSEELGGQPGARLRRFALPWRLPGMIRRRMQEFGAYDVVEVHEPLAGGYAWQRKIGRSLPPLVVLSHGLEARSHQATLAYRQQRGLPISLKERWAPLATVWQANFALRNAQAVVCLNSEDQQFLIAQGIASERLVRIANGVEDTFLKAGAARSAPGREQRILFCGTWVERKGIGELVPAATAVLREFAQARLTIAGCGVAEPVVRASFPTEIQERLTVLPSVAPDTLPNLYSGHDIFVLPSYFEGFPLVMLEAAALKLAIIATDTCGMRDFVRQAQNGLLVPPSRPEELAQRLRDALGNPAWCAELGEQAHQDACRLTWDVVARGLLTAYEIAARTVKPRMIPHESVATSSALRTV
jgi:glycosyltransferase involved in cell wall biosynthesis